MTLNELLSHLRQSRIDLWVDGNRLRYKGASEVMTPELLAEIRSHKQQLIEVLGKAGVQTGTESNAMTIPRRTQQEVRAPLSFAQEGLWYLHQLDPNSIVYNEPWAFTLKGPVSVAVLRKSLNEIVRRHEALRTTFKSESSVPVQVIASSSELELQLIDLSGRPLNERENELTRFLETEARQPFNLAEGPLVRTALVRLASEDHVLFLLTHHIVFDGWSVGVFQRELIALYEAFSAGRSSPLPELPIQYADYAVWQRKFLRGAELERQLAYWRKRLSGKLPVLQMPADYPRPATMTGRGSRRPFQLSKALVDSLSALGRRSGATLFMVLLAAFKTLLYRYTGQEDVIVGAPIANRGQPEVEGHIGFLLNMVVLRTDLQGAPTFRELLSRVRAECLGAYSHQHMPLPRLVEELHPARDLSSPPLFQAILSFQDWRDRTTQMADISFRVIDLGTATTKADLDISVQDIGEGVQGVLEYNADLFDAVTITRMLGHFQTLLEGIVTHPEQRISELPLLTPAEHHQLMVEWNATEADYPRDKCIHHLFEAQVERTPDAVAVVFEDEQLTYRELNTRANQLAHHLQALGVGPEMLVGIFMERSLEMVIGLYGILKAGGAYVPLDAAYPQERLAFMLADAQVPVLLTQEQLVAGLPEHGAQILCLDTDWETIAHERQQNPAGATTPDNLAYVIYTSGSTGEPKGVMIQHQSLVNYIEAASVAYALTPGDRVLQFASISFDASADEIYACLIRGATLVLRTDAMLDPSMFLEKCQDWNLTVLSLPTAYWHDLIARLTAEAMTLPPSVRLVIIGGERAVPQRLAMWREHVDQHVRLVNAYGPTEATVGATLCDLQGSLKPDTPLSREVPIGRPMPNLRVYILDQFLQPVPIGVPGELHIAGVGLARGYLNRPELTAEKFIANPFSEEPQARLYKTGDLARYFPDGNIEYLGRLDHQVKIRGFRIEPGEIEAVLAQHPAMAESVVVAREDTPGDRRLVAYLVCEQSAPTTSELRSFLKEKLPDYMVPAAFVFLDALPLTPNGKVDRQALPAPDQGRPELGTTVVAPRDALEVQLTNIWKNVLGQESIGVRDNFFELGGHSLLAVQLVHQIEKVLGRTLPVIALFQAPTVEQLAEALRQEDPSRDWASVVPLQPNGAKPPFFFLAGRTHFGDRLGPDQPVYRVVYQDLDREQPLVRIEDMAAYSIKSVRTIQPDGPYYLGGHGNGGAVAFEIAHQLQRQGQKVALLTLCESPAPGSRPSTPGTSSAYRLWQRVPYYFQRVRRNGARQVLAGLLIGLKKKIMVVVWRRQSGPRTRSRQGHRAAAYDALRHYVPQAYSGRITVIRCTERAPWREDDPLNGWGRLATDGVDAYEIPGSHTSIYKEPNVGMLASTLKDILHKAQARAENERRALADPSVSAAPITRADGDDWASSRPDDRVRRMNTDRLAAKL